MSTETGTSPPNPLPATPDQPTEEVKTMDQEALALVNKGERDETASAEKLPNQATLGSNTKGETENKQTEPPTVEVKDIDEDPAVDVPDQNKREEEKDSIPVSHTNTCPQPVAEALNSHAVEQQATESVVKEEVERPDVASLEKEQQKQTNTGGAPESSVEAIEMPQQQSEVLHVQESEDLNSQAVEQQATESVVKEEVERPDVASLEKEQQEQTNTGGAPESSVEAIEMPQQQSEVLHVQESEAVPAKDMEDSAVSKEVDKPKKIVAEFDQKVEEQSKINITAEVELKVEEQPEVNNQAELLEPVEPVEFLPVEKPEVVGEYSIEDSKTETKETDEPEPTVPQIRAKPDEHSEVTNQDEKTESVIPEVEVKQDRHKSSEQVESGSIEKETSKDEGMLACKVEDTTLGKEGKTSEQKESSAIAEPVISTNQSAQADVVEDKEAYSPAVVIEEDEKKETYGTEPVEVPSKVAVGEGEKIKEVEETKNKATEVPEIKVKLEEHSEVTNQDEKTESVIPEVEVKQDRHKSSEQVESGSIEKETSKDEVMLACKVEDTTLGKEGKTSEQKESSAIAEPVISTNQNAQADVVEDKVGYSPAVVIEEDEKKETYGTEPVEVPSKVAVGEGEKIIEEEETKKNATEVNVQRDLLNEELAEPIKMEEVKNAVSNAEVSAKQFEGEIIGEVLEPVAKNEKDEIIIGGRSALVETGKDEKVELDVTAKNEKDVLEPVAENKKDEIIIGGRSALVETGKDEKVELDVTAKTNEDKLEKENIETVKSDVQNSEPSTKDGNDTKAPQDLPPEVPAKPPQKQSSNILTKVKQSLVKAKKAIIGKSPNPKTVSSNAKDDIKVK